MSQYVRRIKLTVKGNKNIKAKDIQSNTGEELAGMGNDPAVGIKFIDADGCIDGNKVDSAT